MKTYTGTINEHGDRTVLVDGQPLDPRLDLAIHAGSWSWADGSPGSEQLALALIADAVGPFGPTENPPKPEDLEGEAGESFMRGVANIVHNFAGQFVALLPPDSFSVTQEQVTDAFREARELHIRMEKRRDRFSWGPGDVEVHEMSQTDIDQINDLINLGMPRRG